MREPTMFMKDKWVIDENRQIFGFRIWLSNSNKAAYAYDGKNKVRKKDVKNEG